MRMEGGGQCCEREIMANKVWKEMYFFSKGLK